MGQSKPFANSRTKGSRDGRTDIVNPKANHRRDAKKVEIDAWIPEIIATSLARDIENFLRVSAVDQVDGERLDLQAQVLLRTREKLDTLEARLLQETKFGAGLDPQTPEQQALPHYIPALTAITSIQSDLVEVKRRPKAKRELKFAMARRRLLNIMFR